MTDTTVQDALAPQFEYVETTSVTLAGGATLTTNNYSGSLYEPQISTDANYPDHTLLTWGDYSLPSNGYIAITFKVRIKEGIACQSVPFHNTAIFNYTLPTSQRSKRIYD